MARNFSCGTYKSECQLEDAAFFNEIGVGETLDMYDAEADICIHSQPLQCSNATTTNGTVNYYWNVGATSILALNASSEQTKQSPMLKGISGGAGTATVTASAGACQSTGSNSPTVQVPTATRVVSTTIDAAATDCPAGTAGWNRIVKKIVTDQETPAQDMLIDGQLLTETYTVVVPNAFGLTSVQTSTPSTSGGGYFNDKFELCSSLCPASTSTMKGTQTISDQYVSQPYALAPNQIVWSCKSNTINGN
jgi:hypothetical protein